MYNIIHNHLKQTLSITCGKSSTYSNIVELLLNSQNQEVLRISHTRDTLRNFLLYLRTLLFCIQSIYQFDAATLQTPIPKFLQLYLSFQGRINKSFPYLHLKWLNLFCIRRNLSIFYKSIYQNSINAISFEFIYFFSRFSAITPLNIK